MAAALLRLPFIDPILICDYDGLYISQGHIIGDIIIKHGDLYYKSKDLEYKWIKKHKYIQDIDIPLTVDWLKYLPKFLTSLPNLKSIKIKVKRDDNVNSLEILSGCFCQKVIDEIFEYGKHLLSFSIYFSDCNHGGHIMLNNNKLYIEQLMSPFFHINTDDYYLNIIDKCKEIWKINKLYFYVMDDDFLNLYIAAESNSCPSVITSLNNMTENFDIIYVKDDVEDDVEYDTILRNVFNKCKSLKLVTDNDQLSKDFWS